MCFIILSNSFCYRYLEQRPAPGPLHVDVLDLTPTTLRLTTELPGRITAFKQAEVRPQVTGILKSRLYKEGAQVEAGDVLYEIDPTTYQSNVNSAKAQLAKALTSEETSRILMMLTQFTKKPRPKWLSARQI